MEDVVRKYKGFTETETNLHTRQKKYLEKF